MIRQRCQQILGILRNQDRKHPTFW